MAGGGSVEGGVEGAKPKPGPMLAATNREIRRLPRKARLSALATLARRLSEEFDAGDRAAAGPLMRALDGLRKLAADEEAAVERAQRAAQAPQAAAPAPAALAEGDSERDELDDMARMRAARLADAAGVVRAIGGDQRGRRGAAAR